MVIGFDFNLLQIWIHCYKAYETTAKILRWCVLSWSFFLKYRCSILSGPNSVFGIATALQKRRPRDHNSIPGRDKNQFSQHPDQLWSQPSCLTSWLCNWNARVLYIHSNTSCSGVTFEKKIFARQVTSPPPSLDMKNITAFKTASVWQCLGRNESLSLLGAYLFKFRFSIILSCIPFFTLYFYHVL